MTEWLTKKECEILMLKCQGVTDEEIARQLNITVKAVEDHISNILSKLRATDRTGAVATALEQRLPHNKDL